MQQYLKCVYTSRSTATGIALKVVRFNLKPKTVSAQKLNFENTEFIQT